MTVAILIVAAITLSGLVIGGLLVLALLRIDHVLDRGRSAPPPEPPAPVRIPVTMMD